MGGQNVLEGKVASVSGNVATLESRSGGRFEVPVDGAGPAVGQSLRLAVRRDKIETRKLEGDSAPVGTNSVVGTVRITEYQGTWVKVTMKAGETDEFVANVLDEQFFREPVREGDRVLASWRLEAVHRLAS
jgi:hypothetical protein